jgi:hypothetical protein
MFAIYSPPPPRNPTCMLHSNLFKQDLTHIFFVTRSHVLGDGEGEGEDEVTLMFN